MAAVFAREAVVAESFNPYREWLGVSDATQPNHYQCLALRQFENDAESIALAGDRAMTKVRSFRPGSQAREWSRLLDAIQTAKDCLLDPAQKSRYDAMLRGASGPTPPAAPQAAGP